MNPSDMPYGAGSVQIRSAQYWMIYRDAEGTPIQENCWTLDRDEARRKLAARAIETLEARLEALRVILNEGPHQTPAEGARAGRGAALGGKREGAAAGDGESVVRSGRVRSGSRRSGEGRA